jgi:hypothetical protein
LCFAVIPNEPAIPCSDHHHLDDPITADPAIRYEPAHLESQFIEEIISASTPWPHPSVSLIERPRPIRQVSECIP